MVLWDAGEVHGGLPAAMGYPDQRDLPEQSRNSDYRATTWSPTPQIAPSLGRNLGSCRGAATCNAQRDRRPDPANGCYSNRDSSSWIFGFRESSDSAERAGCGPTWISTTCSTPATSQHEHDLRCGVAGRSADPRRPPGEDRRAVRLLTRGLDCGSREWLATTLYDLEPEEEESARCQCFAMSPPVWSALSSESWHG